MAEFINVADLVDPNDSEGRTYREVNSLKQHLIELGSLVELESGVRLFVTRHTRDCDGAPLYTLSVDEDDLFHHYGYSDENLKLIE
jgi:hypothetical protein